MRPTIFSLLVLILLGFISINGSEVSAGGVCPTDVSFSSHDLNHTISRSGVTTSMRLRYDNNANFSSPEVDVIVNPSSYNVSLPSSGTYYIMFSTVTDPPYDCSVIQAIF